MLILEKRLYSILHLSKWYIKKGLKRTKFCNAIKYKPSKSFQLFADEVSDARRAGDVDKNYD